MKFAVQPAGATMQPAALTPGLCTPGHSVLSASSPTANPVAPACLTCLATALVYQLATGRSAPALPAHSKLTATAHTSAALRRLRIRDESPCQEKWTNLARRDARSRYSSNESGVCLFAPVLAVGDREP
jgi:hypothetical protein